MFPLPAGNRQAEIWQNLYPVTDESHVNWIRRRALDLAHDLRFSEVDAGRASIIVTELGQNLRKHAQAGEIVLGTLDGQTLDILSLDKGPGMTDLQKCLSDGFSTSGTPGTGLGAIVRQSDVFDIFTQPKSGTVIYSNVRSRSAGPVSVAKFEMGAVCLPVKTEETAGDGWTFRTNGSQITLLVTDGLGHGIQAHQAAVTSVRLFGSINPNASTEDILRDIHGGMRSTRGAAGAVVKVNTLTGDVRFAGVGNITGIILGSNRESRSMVSHNGILGFESRRIQEFSYSWAPDSTLVMHSDGIATLHLERYAGLLQRHPQTIAGVIYRDFNREKDDSTVVIVRSSKS